MDIILSTTSKEPLFLQIKQQIQQQIFENVLQEGDALPSMRALAKALNVSVITTKRAYEELEQDGYVVSTVGKGTFVAGQQAHILREWQIRALEREVEQLVQEAKRLSLTKQALHEMLDIYYEEE